MPTVSEDTQCCDNSTCCQHAVIASSLIVAFVSSHAHFLVSPTQVPMTSELNLWWGPPPDPAINTKRHIHQSPTVISSHLVPGAMPLYAVIVLK